ncbi:hypothetical protein NTE_02744 [Candidatus Nitrososphaera evergladensis SR1]|uniref:Uncharacterized protein n=1 Tax=Candidatus Nitrososphaera evergladensis SR1 TaxID=1459636 RepID=A0A075MTA1_9ARCH|nr:hypothetical protein NTE_02744 [Candidatus Nitrososphaera evergladensis SR1]
MIEERRVNAEERDTRIFAAKACNRLKNILWTFDGQYIVVYT